MPFPSGRYTIRSAIEGNLPIGVSSDVFPGRGKVVMLPGDSKPSQWIIESAGDESAFIIKTPDGKAVGQGDNAVWVGGPPTVWFLEPAFHHGKDVYVISNFDERFKGWVTPFEEEGSKQLIYRPLIIGRSLPPFYPPNERFIIEKAYD